MTGGTKPAWLTFYEQLGLRLFYWERTGDPEREWKKAIGENWNDRSRVDDFSRFDPSKHNVGTITGYELQPGKFLVDVDLDANTPEPLLTLLPSTEFIFGRPSRPVSHAFYTVPERLPSVREYKDADGQKFVELFGGDFTQYTMIPPSIRSPNEPLQFRRDSGISHIKTEELLTAMRDFAVATVLHRTLGHRGFGHSMRLCIAGFLLKEGLSEDTTNRIGRVVALLTGNDPEDFSLVCRTTSAHLQGGNKRVVGRQAIVNELGDAGKKMISKLKQLIGNDEFVRDEKGKINPTNIENIRIALDKLDVSLSYNKFSQKLYVQNGHGPQLLDDPTWIPLWFKIDEHFQFRPSEHLFLNVLRDTGWKNGFHPVLEYLSHLQWDGKPRLDTWLRDYGQAGDSKFIRSIAAKVLIAAVRRVRQPGCKFDEMLILESEQGKTKSSAIMALCPDVRWFSDDLPLGAESKEVIEATAGKWILEAAELQNIRGKEVEKLKAFLSRPTDGPVRLAYDRTPTEVPRQWIIIGTTNLMTGYLRDSTGNRRFWPVRVQQFDIEGMRRDRDQLWAEASTREATGESIRLEQELWEAAAAEQEKRRLNDDWEEELCELTESDWIPTNVIWDKLGIRANMRDPRHATRVYEIMQRFGYTEKQRLSVRYVVDGKEGSVKQQWCWVRGHINLGRIVRWISNFDGDYIGYAEKAPDGPEGGLPLSD